MGINVPRGAQKSVWRNNVTLFSDKSPLWADKWPLSMSEIRGHREVKADIKLNVVAAE